MRLFLIALTLLVPTLAWAPDITITIPADKVARVQAGLNAYNARTGRTYTASQWLRALLIENVVHEIRVATRDADEAARQAALEAEQQGW